MLTLNSTKVKIQTLKIMKQMIIKTIIKFRIKIKNIIITNIINMNININTREIIIITTITPIKNNTEGTKISKGINTKNRVQILTLKVNLAITLIMNPIWAK